MPMFIALFAFIPVTLMFAVNGPGYVNYVFLTLMLIWTGKILFTNLVIRAESIVFLHILEKYRNDAKGTKSHAEFSSTLDSLRMFKDSRK